MDELKKNFYAQLGKLSVNFSKMEFKLGQILNYLIGTEEDLISVTLTENNSLHQTIELIKKINRIKDFQPKTMKELLERIAAVKSYRNLFIHGIWGEPYESENDIKIVCEERKIRYQEEQTEYGTNKHWRYNNHQTFRLSFLRQLTIKIDDIILAQDYMLKKLDEEKWN
ncbi:hypothetical protein [Marinoscillum furvescens]|uniref:Uncharacterized protein n=1 Tax=Marinoscillum furvescens DSM 4134 TaxID=1122208 RepID=A0A3D9KWS6_MARFU|nr:hypothetical protein [Marinoscillum furvescens]RED92853.1 hypothetical protein C7460_12872 [Marinoscillum furvescens DSM 4134]